MMFKVVLLAVLVLVTVEGGPVEKRAASPFQLMSIIHIEEPCVRQGGLCLRIEDCDPGNMVQVRGILCPNQSHLGVECCYVNN